MGCVSSKIETEAAVKHCKARKQYMKQAVARRHKFAAAHAFYAKSLKSTGAAIRQMAEVEAIPEGTPQPAPPPLSIRHTPVSTLVPPLPPLPPPHPPEDPFLGPRTPLSRAVTMPPIPIKSLSGSPARHSHPHPLIEDIEELHEDQGYSLHKPTHSETLYDPFENFPGPGTSTFDNEDFELKLPEKEDDEVEDYENYQVQPPILQIRRSVEEKIASGRETKKQPQGPPIQQKVGKSDQSFGTILRNLDDLFMESYAAAGNVSRLLDAKRDYHYPPRVNEKSGIEEHNSKVSKILTWTQSSPGASLANDDEISAHNLASTLDRLHAWEKKLCDEVKAAEATRLELMRRSAYLKNPRQGHESSTTFEKTKALVKSLNTRYLVEVEAMDAAYSEVKKLRDKSLYPELMNLLKGLTVMWKEMHSYHQSQVPLVEELSNLATPSTKQTSEYCKKITEDLEREVTLWHDSLEDMVRFQKDCATSLLEWLRLNTKQIENEAVDYLPALQNADVPLYDMCQAWYDVVDRLSAEQVLDSLRQFLSKLKAVSMKQVDEIKQKKRKEDLYRELERKKKAFEQFESKYKEKASSKGTPQASQDSVRHPIQERRAFVELLQKNVAEEEQTHAKLCEENSTMIFQSLKEGLPEVVNSIETFSHSCAKKYEELHKLLGLDKIPSDVSSS